MREFVAEASDAACFHHYSSLHTCCWIFAGLSFAAVALLAVSDLWVAYSSIAAGHYAAFVHLADAASGWDDAAVAEWRKPTMSAWNVQKNAAGPTGARHCSKRIAAVEIFHRYQSAVAFAVVVARDAAVELAVEGVSFHAFAAVAKTNHCYLVVDWLMKSWSLRAAAAA